VAYSESLKQKVFQDFCSGTYSSMLKLAEAHGIKRLNTLLTWAKKEDWHQKRAAAIARAQKTAEKRLEDSLESANSLHLSAWRAVYAQAMLHLKTNLTRDGKPYPLNVDTLMKVANTLRMAQIGQRIALGADLPDAIQAARVEVVFGLKSEDGEVRGGNLEDVAQEVIKQYESKFSPEQLEKIGARNGGSARKPVDPSDNGGG